MLFAMDGYLQILYKWIIMDIAENIGSHESKHEYTLCSDGLHKFVQEVKGLSNAIFNFNEEGRLHSKYLGDRYEPAIILHFHYCPTYYYLFDGEIKDCVHPFNVQISPIRKRITYYSSERIKQELPIGIYEEEFVVFKIYNDFNSYPLIEGYKKGGVRIDITGYVKQDYLLHDCMEPLMPFKFAD